MRSFLALSIVFHSAVAGGRPPHPRPFLAEAGCGRLLTRYSQRTALQLAWREFALHLHRSCAERVAGGVAVGDARSGGSRDARRRACRCSKAVPRIYAGSFEPGGEPGAGLGQMRGNGAGEVKAWPECARRGVTCERVAGATTSVWAQDPVVRTYFSDWLSVVNPDAGLVGLSTCD